MTIKLKKFAFYLPQFHACDANDEFWEPGFTDWVTTLNAKPLFNGHNQPVRPTLLGQYDLSNPEIIKKQANLAKKYCIDGFAIYHYWFDKGERALDEPIEIIRKNRDIDISYFISWVNCNWTKSWIGDNNTIIREQKYNDDFYDELIKDSILHFEEKRYYKIEGSPVFYIHSPNRFNVKYFIERFTDKAKEHGFKKIIWIAPEIHVNEDQFSLFDYLLSYPPGDYNKHRKSIKTKLWQWICNLPFELYKNKFFFKKLRVFDYSTYVTRYIDYIEKNIKLNSKYIATAMHSWDNSPRYKYKSFIYKNASPQENYRLYNVLFSLSKENNRPFVLIKSWNEWAEGNVLEPDDIYQLERLKALKQASLDS